MIAIFLCIGSIVFIIIIMLRQQVWIILQTLLFCYEKQD